ncbi:unnamed protein product [Chrysoparadoxa australica]
MQGSRRISGSQAEVFSLYRSFLRAAAQKDRREADLIFYLIVGGSTVAFVKSLFRSECRSIPRSNYALIEHKLRAGHKKLKLLKMPGAKGARPLSVKH